MLLIKLPSQLHDPVRDLTARVEHYAAVVFLREQWHVYDAGSRPEIHTGHLKIKKKLYIPINI